MRSGSNIVPELCCIALFGESRVAGFDKENPLRYHFDSHLPDITGSELVKPDRPVQSGFAQEPGKCETLMWLSAQAALREEIFRPLVRVPPTSLFHSISIIRPIPILIGSNSFFYIGPSPSRCTVSGNVSLLRLHSWLPRYPRPYGTIGTIEPFF